MMISTTDSDQTIVVEYKSQWPAQAIRFGIDRALDRYKANDRVYDEIKKIEACVEECQHENLTSYDIDGDTQVVCMDCEEHIKK